MDVQQQTGPVFWSSDALAQMTPQAVLAQHMAPPSSTAMPNPIPSASRPNGNARSATDRILMPKLAAASPPPMSIPPAPTATPASPAKFISLADGRFSYEPYPIIGLGQTIDRGVQDEMLAQWPPQHFFKFRRELGSVYALSAESNGTNFEWYIENTPVWRDLHAHVTSSAFVQYVLDTLAAGQIVTGYRAQQLTSRFEFSMLAAEGGHVMPHTDPPQRVITIEIFLVGQNEWDPAWGGGTAILKPTDITQNYNFMNQPARFEQMTCLETFPYLSGDGVMLVKTFNSYRAIYPMTGRAPAVRRCLVITLDDPSISRAT